jgi:hypothetical protein
MLLQQNLKPGETLIGQNILHSKGTQSDNAKTYDIAGDGGAYEYEQYLMAQDAAIKKLNQEKLTNKTKQKWQEMQNKDSRQKNLLVW